MSITSGFFNSINHDRLYDAEQISSIFDGVILDGVYESIGDAFQVSVNPEVDNSILVGTGRAWFDHTWTLNDSVYDISITEPNVAMGRIDAVVLDINREKSVRQNTIKYIPGLYGSTPQKPELIKSELHNQYPLAYITVPAGSDKITNSDIERMVGTSECPIVTGILEVINSDKYWQQLESDFNIWWDGIKDVLDENAVANILNRVNNLDERVEDLEDNALDLSIVNDLDNIKITKTYQLTNGNAYENSYMLPDGWVLIIRATDANDFSSISNSGDPKAIYAALVNHDGVISNDVTINGKSTNRVYSRVCMLGSNDTTYPMNIYIAYTYSSAYNENNHTRIHEYKTYVDKLTVTSDHVISSVNVYVDDNSSKVEDNVIAGNLYSSNIHVPLFPAKLNTGVRLFPAFIIPTGGGNWYYSSYMLSYDGVPSKVDSFSGITYLDGYNISSSPTVGKSLMYAFTKKDDSAYYVFLDSNISSNDTKSYYKFNPDGSYSGTEVVGINSSEYGDGVASCKVLNSDELLMLASNKNFGVVQNHDPVLVDSGYTLPIVLDYSSTGSGTITSSIESSFSGVSGSESITVDVSSFTNTGFVMMLPDHKSILKVYENETEYYGTVIKKSAELGFESGGHELGSNTMSNSTPITGIGRLGDFLGMLFSEHSVYFSEDGKTAVILVPGYIDAKYSGMSETKLIGDDSHWGPAVYTIKNL